MDTTHILRHGCAGICQPVNSNPYYTLTHTVCTHTETLYALGHAHTEESAAVVFEQQGVADKWLPAANQVTAGQHVFTETEASGDSFCRSSCCLLEP